MKNIINLVLLAVAAFLGYLVFNSINAPIKFNKERDVRYTEVIKKLADIRDTQVAYKSVKGSFAKNFDQLFAFVETGKFFLIEKKDTSYMKYDRKYRIDKLFETVIIDTLGSVMVKDSLFKNKDYKLMKIVPGTDKEFEMKTGILEKGGMRVSVFEAKVPKKVVLEGMDEHLISEEEISAVVKGAYLQVGSLEKAITNGNWPKTYESEL